MSGRPTEPASEAAALTEAELAALTERFAAGEAQALALTGSFARGDATTYSDVDLLRFVACEPTTDRQHYELSLIDGRLVSVTTTTLAAKRAELARPEAALWAAPGLRQAHILFDRDGGLAALLAEAHAFAWTPALREAAHDYVSAVLGGLAEEVYKLLGAMGRDDESAMLYATLGLQQSLIGATLVAHETLLTTENDFFRTALAVADPDSRWARLLRIVAGYDALPPGISQPRGRGAAALWLYVEAAALLSDALTPADRTLVAEATRRIHRVLGEREPWQS